MEENKEPELVKQPNILTENKTPVVQNNNGGNKGLVGLLVLIILLLAGALAYVLYFKPNAEVKDNNTNNTEEKEQITDNETSNEETKEENKEIEEKKYALDVYKNSYGNLCESKDSDCKEKALTIKTETADAKIIKFDGMYEKFYVLYDDNGLKLYDVKKGTSQKINLSNKYEEYEIVMDQDYRKAVGIKTLDKNDYLVYYSLSAGKTLYNNKYKLGDSGHNYATRVDENYIYVQANGTAYILNANKEEVKLTIKIGEDYCGFTHLGDKQYVYTYGCGADSYDITKIYTKDLKAFYEVDANALQEFEVTFANNSAYIKDGNNVKKYNANGELVTTKSYGEIFLLDKEYVIYQKDGNLILENLENGKESKTLVKMNEFRNVDRYGSHYYDRDTLDLMGETNKKVGMYVIVEYDGKDANGNYGMEYCYTTDKKVIEYPIKTEIGGRAKPVLYLYPEKETNVTVKFEKPELITTTYPKYINSWNVKVSPNGDMVDKNGKYYYALYWDEKRYNEVNFNEGFYVEGKDAIKFLEEKLAIIGLSDKERNEFIMYWLPIMEVNKKNLVYFELTKERELGNKLIISPKPDSLLRVSIHIKKVNSKTTIKEQKLETFKRVGFTAVEWGGMTY